MKTQTLRSLITVGALVPMAAWSQTTGIQTYAYNDTAADKPGAEAREDHRPSASSARGMDQSRAPEASAPGGTSSGPTSATAATSEIQRIPAEELPQRVTASSLMGKKVVDREGQEIGKVKDVGLTAVAPQLAPPPPSDGRSSGARSSQPAAPGSRGGESAGVSIGDSTSPGLRPAESTGMDDGRLARQDPFLAEQKLRREVDRAGTAGSDPGLEAGSRGDRDGAARVAAAGAGEAREPRTGATRNVNTQSPAPGAETRILVQPERSLGLGQGLVAIPTSQLHREGDTLRLDLSREELREIVARQPASSRVSMAE